MFRRRGVTLAKAPLTAVCMLAAPLTLAISVGNLHFRCRPRLTLSANVVNNNKSAPMIPVLPSVLLTARAAVNCAPDRWMVNCPPRQLAAGWLRASILNFTIMVHG